MRRTVKLFISTAMAGLVAIPSGANAQDAEGEIESEAPPASGLSEIVVTAQRREENLQRAALAITAVSGEDLSRASITDTAGLARVAPSLQVSTIGGSATQFYLRGVGNFTTNSNSDAAVAVAVDGVTIARSSAVQGMFYDLERVEVLKGPQGTLYGRNATGGQINVITRGPELGEAGGYVTAEYGNFDNIKLEGAVNAPVGEDSAVRVSGMLSDHDGYLSDGTNDENLKAVRAQFRTELGDIVRLRVGADYAHVGGEGPGVTLQGLDRDERIGSLDPRANPVIESGFVFSARSFLDSRQGIDVYQDNQYYGVFAQADIETPLGTLTVLPAYRRAEVDFVACTAQCFQSVLKDDQITVEARLASDTDGPFHYILGGFFLDEQANERANYNQDFAAFYSSFTNDTQSYAAFARLTYDVSDVFRLTLGGRYTIDEKAVVIDSINTRVICLPTVPNCIGTPAIRPIQLNPPSYLLNAAGNPIPAQPYPGGVNGSLITAGRVTTVADETFKKFTYRIGFEYDVAPRSLLYGSFETGFKSGGFFSSIDNPVFQPETIDAWTLGSKNRFLNNRLQLNLELFWWEYQDQQVSRLATNRLGGIEFRTDNIGETRIRGAELEAVARVTPTTTINGLVQYLDTERTDYVYETPAFVGPPVTGCPFARNGAVFVVNCTGTPSINAPEWSVNAGIEQRFELNANSRLVLNADGRYRSSSFVGNEHLPQQVEDGYFTADLQLKLELDEPDIFIAGFVNNVSDEQISAFTSYHPGTLVPTPVGGNVIFELLRPPRTYGVRVGFNF